MAASNFANPQFQTSPAKQVQAPVVQAPQQSGSGLKGVLTGLAQLGMGIATDNPALMASGASGAVLGPKAGKLAGTLAGAAGGGTAPAATAPSTGGNAGQTAASGAATAGNAATTSSAPAAIGGQAGGDIGGLSLLTLMQALGKNAPNPSPQNDQRSA